MSRPLASQICFARERVASTAARTIAVGVRSATRRRRALNDPCDSLPLGAASAMRFSMFAQRQKSKGMRSGELFWQHFEITSTHNCFQCQQKLRVSELSCKTPYPAPPHPPTSPISPGRPILAPNFFGNASRLQAHATVFSSSRNCAFRNFRVKLHTLPPPSPHLPHIPRPAHFDAELFWQRFEITSAHNCFQSQQKLRVSELSCKTRYPAPRIPPPPPYPPAGPFWRQSVSQSVGQSVSQSVRHSVIQPAGRAASQAVGRPTSQSINQSIGLPAACLRLIASAGNPRDGT